MKILVIAALLAATLGAAPPNPVLWKIQDVPSKPVKPGARLTIKVLAQIEEGWHLYSMKPLPDGPIPTRIWIAEGQPAVLSGQIVAPAPQSVQDPNFGMEVEFYEGQAIFTLPVRAASAPPAGARTLEVSASYQACNDKLCLPPRTVKIEVPFEFAK